MMENYERKTDYLRNIVGYIDSLAKAAVLNLIVDVRNNPG